MYKQTQKEILEAVKKNGGYRVSIHAIESDSEVIKAKEDFLRDFAKNMDKYGLTSHCEWAKININRLIEKGKIRKDEAGFITLTEPGWITFESIHRRFWYSFKKDIRTIVLAVITTLITLFIRSII
jgi:hypothetical protein